MNNKREILRRSYNLSSNERYILVSKKRWGKIRCKGAHSFHAFIEFLLSIIRARGKKLGNDWSTSSNDAITLR